MKNINALLKKVEVFERLAVYGDRKSFLQSLSQELPKVVVPNEGPPGSGGHFYDPNQLQDDVAPPVDRDPNLNLQHALNPNAVKEQAAKPARTPAQFDPRVKAVQEFLNNTLVPAGVISPIDQDGKWGTETASALKQWGDKNRLSGVPLTAVFTAAQAQAETNRGAAQINNMKTPGLDAARKSV